MRVNGQPVSKTSSGEWCIPNPEYGGNAHHTVEIDLNEYEVIAVIPNNLPPNDEKWPKGAVMEGIYKVGNQIVRKKS
jgi:hypothetical protein